MRVSFASASHAELRQGMERLGATLRAAQAAPGRAGLAGSHAPHAVAADGAEQHSSASIGEAAAQPAADSTLSTGQSAANFANGQNRHADSAAVKPSALPHQRGTENSYAAGMPNGQSMGSTRKGAADCLPGLRVNEDAGKGTQQTDRIPDGAAKTLASGSVGVTADALAPRFAKTLDPRDSAWTS